MQLVQQDRAFEIGFYQCMPQGATQVWSHLVPHASGDVRINITGIQDNNGEWLPLNGLPNAKLTNSGNQLVMDLTPVVNDMSDLQWKELKNYLLAAYWLTGKEPLLKSGFPDSPKKPEELSKKVNKLLKKNNYLHIDFNRGDFLVGRDHSWAIRARDAYEMRDRNDGTNWEIALYAPAIKTLLKDIPDKSKLDLTSFGLPSTSTLLDCFIKQTPFSSILLKKFGKAEYDHLENVKYSDADFMAFFLKVRGLEKLKLAHMDRLKNLDLSRILSANRDTITHLDLTGSEINLCQHYNFVNVVGKMMNLQSLKIIGTGLSNDHTVVLARNLRDLEKLSLVHIEMPYWINTGIEGWWRAMGEECQELWGANVVEMPYRGLKIATTALPAAAFSFVLGTGVDIVSYYAPGVKFISDVPTGVDFREVLMSLSGIKSLTSLKMKIKGVSQQKAIIEEFFNSRRNSKLTIEFE